MRRIIKPLAIGGSIGVLLVLIRHLFDLDEHHFSVMVRVLAVLVIVGAVLYDLFYTMPLRKKVLHTMKLVQDGKAEEGIAQIEELLQEATQKKQKSTQIVCRLNLAAAYLDLKRYEDALPILEALSEERLNKQARLVHAINLCSCYFSTDQVDKALALYSENEKLFSSYRSHKSYGGNLAVLQILSSIAQGEYQAAQKALDAAKVRWDDPHLCAAYDMIEKTLDSVQGSAGDELKQ